LLTAQEIKIITLIAEAKTNQQIADRLFLSRRTIDTHVQNIYAKTGVHSRIELAAVWARIAQEGEPVEPKLPAAIPPVRITVDLTPAYYRQLTGYVIAAAAELEVKVTMADTLRAMIAAAAENPAVSREVHAAILANRVRP
jgi:DNA-binding CsgD family transcriptional regulator